jgi:hypothetical protein
MTSALGALLALATPETALQLVTRLCGLAVFLQAYELARARDLLGDDGLWPWAELRRDHASAPPPLRALLDVLLGRAFVVVIAMKAGSGFAMLAAPRAGALAVVPALASALLVSLRFRGRENGAADAMTNLVLLALGVASVAGMCFAVDVSHGALVFVAAQAQLSYFVAGATKLRSSAWRSGRALRAFVSLPRYAAPAWAKRVVDTPGLAGLFGVLVGGWQTLSPLALLSPSWCAASCFVGAGFHVVNFAVFGLQRFFWAWLCTYPALLHVAAALAEERSLSVAAALAGAH